MQNLPIALLRRPPPSLKLKQLCHPTATHQSGGLRHTPYDASSSCSIHSATENNLSSQHPGEKLRTPTLHATPSLIVQEKWRKVAANMALKRFNLAIRNNANGTKLKNTGNNTIHKLLQYSAVDEAFSVFRTLIDRHHLPSGKITSLLLQAAAKQVKPAIVQHVLDVLDSGVLLWDDVLVGNLLDILSQAGRPDIMKEVIDNYSASKADQTDKWTPNPVICSLMIKAYAQAGKLEAAIDWLQQYRKEDNNSRSEDPYIHLLYGFAHRPGRGLQRKANSDACYKILKQMELDGVPPSIKAINIILSMELRKWNFRRIAACWRVLTKSSKKNQSSASAARPDAATYAILFKCLENRGLSNRWRPLVPPGRALFKHMLASHHASTNGKPWLPSPYLNAATLNVALRYFVVSRDYAAAVVALRSFTVCSLVPTEYTEWIVASTVLKRMGREIRSILKTQAKDRYVDTAYVKWVDRMHGRLLRAESALLEHRHIEDLLREMKMSRRARKVLPAEEVDQAEGLLESLGYHTARCRLQEANSSVSRVETPTPLLQGAHHPRERRPNLTRSLALLKQSIIADLTNEAPGGILHDEERAFGGVMALANAELLPLRTSERVSRFSRSPSSRSPQI